MSKLSDSEIARMHPETLALSYGFDPWLSEGAVKVAAHRLRQRYRELLREEVAHTVAAPDDVEGELSQLFAALGA